MKANALLFLLFLTSCFGPALAAASDEPRDAVERATGLKKVTGENFILDMKYASPDNFLKTDVYSPFGLAACYVRPEMYDQLEKLKTALARENLRLVIFDCYRPLEVQKAMWEILPDRRYVANPATGSLHNRGGAIDCALADENGQMLPFPTAFDDFSAQAGAAYQCPAENPAPCRNRDRLADLMRSAGFQGLNSEWWHFQVPGARQFPLLSLDGGGQ